jgi:hypothetical protein
VVGKLLRKERGEERRGVIVSLIIEASLLGGYYGCVCVLVLGGGALGCNKLGHFS